MIFLYVPDNIGAPQTMKGKNAQNCKKKVKIPTSVENTNTILIY